MTPIKIGQIRHDKYCNFFYLVAEDIGDRRYSIIPLNDTRSFKSFDKVDLSWFNIENDELLDDP
jgi:hypothetical protein